MIVGLRFENVCLRFDYFCKNNVFSPKEGEMIAN